MKDERAFQSIPPCSYYKIKREYKTMFKLRKPWGLALPIILILLFSPLTVPLHSLTLTVQTDLGVYYPGDTVHIDGTGTPGVEARLIVTNSATLLNTTLTIEGDGEFNHALQLKNNATEGNYTLTVTTQDGNTSTQFRVERELCPLYRNLERVLERIRARLVERIMELSDQGEPTEELQERLEEGDALREEARLMALQGECQNVAQKMIQALNQYGEGYRNSNQSEDKDPDHGEIMALKNEIKRGFNLLERLNKTARRLEERGYNTTQIQGDLDKIKGYLAEAQNHLDNGELEEGEEYLELAQELSDQTLETLRELNRERRNHQAKEFIKETQERMKDLKKTLKEKLKNKANPQALENLEKALNKTIDRLEEIQELLDGEDPDDALEDLDEALKENEKDMDELDIDKGQLNRARAIERLHDKIEYLRKKSSQLTEGNETDQIQDKLNQAEEILKNAEEEIENEDSEELIEEAEELIEEADEIIDEIEEKIEEAEKDKEDEEKSKGKGKDNDKDNKEKDDEEEEQEDPEEDEEETEDNEEEDGDNGKDNVEDEENGDEEGEQEEEEEDDDDDDLDDEDEEETEEEEVEDDDEDKEEDEEEEQERDGEDERDENGEEDEEEEDGGGESAGKGRGEGEGKDKNPVN
jgi:hypothetical protein